MNRNLVRVGGKKRKQEKTALRSQETALCGYCKNTEPFSPQLSVKPLLYYKLAKYLRVILMILRLNYVNSTL